MQQLPRLEPPARRAGQPLDMVLDTDTDNEIDDQFALVYALLSSERVTLHAVYAALPDQPRLDPQRARAQPGPHRGPDLEPRPAPPFIREVLSVDRDAIFGDLFRKLRGYRDSA